MKKEDQYQLSRSELIQEAFDQAKEATIAKTDPHYYRYKVKHELHELKKSQYEREQANKEAAQEAERAERTSIEERLKEAEEKLKNNAK